MDEENNNVSMFELERDYHISLFVCSLYEGLVHASLKNTSVLRSKHTKG